MSEYWGLHVLDTMSAISPKLKSSLADARAFIVIESKTAMRLRRSNRNYVATGSH